MLKEYFNLIHQQGEEVTPIIFLCVLSFFSLGVWDPNIRIEPPKEAPSVNQREQRLSHVSSSQAILDGNGNGHGGHGGNGGTDGGHDDEHVGLDRTGR